MLLSLLIPSLSPRGNAKVDYPVDYSSYVSTRIQTRAATHSLAKLIWRDDDYGPASLPMAILPTSS